MPRRVAPLQVNQFTGGLNTEQNLLASPPDTTISEANMSIERNGSRAKRFGMDYEANYTIRNSGIPYDPSKYLGKSTYKWENVGGVASKSLIVVQIGNHFAIYDYDIGSSVSNGLIYSEYYPSTVYSNSFNYTVVDGLLVVVNGEKLVNVYTYSGGSVTKTTYTLYIRDLFGVEANADGYSLFDSQHITYRPQTLPEPHIYNLRNQTFGTSRPTVVSEAVVDPLWWFHHVSGYTVYPSNSDSVIPYVYADPNNSADRLIERFFADHLIKNPIGNTAAPKGRFIIDALERGGSRLNAESFLRSQNPSYVYSVNNLPPDITPGGASVVAQYAGRVFYAGFSAQLIGGDPRSPRMSSYILFSSLVQDSTDIGKCYQEADPTSLEDANIVDTDGGFIRIDGAYDINGLVTIGDSLFIFAKNGVWRLSGTDNTGFRATGYQVSKLTNKGCEASGSLILVESTIYFWSTDAIYFVGQNQYGDWEVKDITQKTIKTLYISFTASERRNVECIFDSYEKTVRWIFYKDLLGSAYTRELIWNIEYNSFTYNEIPVASASLPIVVGAIETDPYQIQTGSFLVTTTSGGTVTTTGLVDVTTSSSYINLDLRETLYLVITSISGTIHYTFGLYGNTTFYDWVTRGTPTSYEAFLETGFITGGEGKLKKQIPYVHTFFRKTEDGFDVNLNPTNASSCLFRAKWNWTYNTTAKKWSPPRQAYRIPRTYFPLDNDDDYINGEAMIVTRNKTRGQGNSVALRFESEAGKNMHIYGWACNLIANDTE